MTGEVEVLHKMCHMLEHKKKTTDLENVQCTCALDKTRYPSVCKWLSRVSHLSGCILVH